MGDVTAERRARSDLEAERDFLLRSIEDLERERAAGDVGADDYAELRSDYVAERPQRCGRSKVATARPNPWQPTSVRDGCVERGVTWGDVAHAACSSWRGSSVWYWRSGWPRPSSPACVFRVNRRPVL